jgi:hypothetical protein
MATFEWEGDPTDVEQRDDLLEAAYRAAPAGLCNHCSGKFSISEDIEVYEISEAESGTKVFEEPTWDDRIRESAANATALNRKLVAELETVKATRSALVRDLRAAGFTVDPHTFAVSR